jgi:chromosome segregation ATPase
MKQLEAERAALEGRRAAFQQAAAEAQAGLDQSETSVEEAITLQARLNAARGALGLVESQIATLDQQISAEQARRDREAAIDRVAALAAAGTRALAELEAARAAANEAMKPLMERIATAIAAVRAARTGFIAEARQLAPGILKLRSRQLAAEDAGRYQVEIDTLLAELGQRGADLKAVRACWNAHERTEIDEEFLFNPVTPFGDAIQVALMAHEQTPPAGAEEIARTNARRHLDAKMLTPAQA